jgi:hypothetical protein
MVATVVVIIPLVIAAAGAAAAITLLLVSWGIRREERDYSLTQQAPGRLSAGARRFTGLYVRQRTDPSPALTAETDIYA